MKSLVGVNGDANGVLPWEPDSTEADQLGKKIYLKCDKLWSYFLYLLKILFFKTD